MITLYQQAILIKIAKKRGQEHASSILRSYRDAMIEYEKLPWYKKFFKKFPELSV